MLGRIPKENYEPIFDELRKLAGNRRTITYGELAKRCGGSARGMHFPLDNILFNICEHRGLPHLNALVVSSKTGIPGRTYQPHGHPVTRDEWKKIVECVYATDWSGVNFK